MAAPPAVRPAPTTALDADRRSVRTRLPRDTRAALLMLTPALIALLAFTYVPGVLSAVASTFDVPLSAQQDWRFVGLDNYRSVISDPAVRQATWNTILYAAFTIVPSLAIGLGLALMADAVRRGRDVWSAILFLPLTANLVAMAVVFSWIFAFRGGFANQVLSLVGVGPVNFLGDGSTALPTVAAVGVWRAASFAMVLYLAGLTSVPTAVHEAAATDGLRGLRKVRLVLLPMLRPTTVLATVITTLQAVQVFDLVEVMTAGGPLGQTETLLTVTWRIGFRSFQLGRASALSFILLLLLLVIGWLQRRALLKEAHQ